MKGTFDTYLVPLALLGAFLLPLKLSFGYVVLVPLLAVWLFRERAHLAEHIHASGPIVYPLLFFLVALSLSSLFGIDPVMSLRAIPSLVFFCALVLLYAEVHKRVGAQAIIKALLYGQAVAGIYSITRSAFPGTLPRLFLGQVTEAGQIALTLLAGVGLYFYSNNSKFSFFISAKEIAWGTINAILLTLFGFSRAFGLPATVQALCALFAITSLIMAFRKVRQLESRDRQSAQALLLGSILLPIVSAALLVTLKRGPWLGVACALTVFFLLYARGLLIPLLCAALVSCFAVSPIRDRLLQSSQHFFIVGGRSVMWGIGLELSSRFPLGVGFKNSPFLQKFSPEIPAQLKHFHSNFINILVEGGWFSFALYLWWIANLLRAALGGPRDPIRDGIGCALLAWQIAGLVEYNFGDSEVLCIALVLIGLLAGKLRYSEAVFEGFEQRLEGAQRC